MHWEVVGKHVKNIVFRYQGHGVKGQRSHDRLKITNLIFSKTVVILYEHMHGKVVGKYVENTLTKYQGHRVRGQRSHGHLKIRT